VEKGIGDMHGSHRHEADLRREARPMMKRHCLDYRGGESPEAEQVSAHLGMARAQFFLFRLP
jgi:hypothetical protein